MQYGVTEVFIKHDYYSKLKIKFLLERDGNLILLQDKGDKFLELGVIETEKKIYTAPDNFHTAQANLDLKYIYEEGDHSVYRYKYIMHVGSSRSSKSWSLEEAAIRTCEEISNLRINIWRDTKESLAGSIWADFKKVFPLSGRKYKFPRNTVPIHFDNNSRIEPHGADSTNAHGTTQDIAWLNEPYKVSDEAFKQIAMRSNQVWIDLNPKQKHWSDTISKHPRCKVIHSTFVLNPFCPPQQKSEILSYDPSNPVNVANGTANEYNWQVYGLGLKAEKLNKIYTEWETMSLAEFIALPYESFYGMDFGQANPSAIAEVKYNDGVFYINQLLYKPEREMKEGLIHEMNRIGLDKSAPIICDPGGQGGDLKILELRRAGYNAKPASKPAGSVFAGISFLQRARVVYTETSPDIEAEYDLYEWDSDRLGVVDKPVKADDHILDAIRYVVMYMQIKLRITF